MQDLIDRIYNFYPCLEGMSFLDTVTSVEEGLTRAETADLRWLAGRICGGVIPDHAAHEKLCAALRAAHNALQPHLEGPREQYRQALRERRNDSTAYFKYAEDTKEAREAYEKVADEAYAVYDKESREECIAIIRKWAANG